eukprot:scaffold73619_cov75-Phaeocystis_antarctica.AAC.2
MWSQTAVRLPFGRASGALGRREAGTALGTSASKNTSLSRSNYLTRAIRRSQTKPPLTQRGGIRVSLPPVHGIFGRGQIDIIEEEGEGVDGGSVGERRVLAIITRRRPAEPLYLGGEGLSLSHLLHLVGRRRRCAA